jgi:uroporphyrinogen decarboxylase
MEWTSRKRVIAAIAHQEPDRVPIDINPLLDFYLNLNRFLGLNIREDPRPNLAMEVIPHPKVLEALNVDCISVKLAPGRRPKPPQRTDGLVQDEWGVCFRRVEQSGGGSYMEVVHSPLANGRIDDLKSYPWPDPAVPGRLEETAAAAKSLYEGTDLALVGRFGGPIIETAVYLMGWENWLVAASSDPEFAGALLDRITEIMIEIDRIGLEAAAPYLQILKVSGEDLGMQTGPIYSPRMFRSLLLPRLMRRWEAARGYLDRVNPGCQIMLHSCGSVRHFIPDLIEAGIQILDPVQPKAAMMDALELKKEFGDRLTFHGGIDIQQVLPFGSKQQVADEVCRCIQAFGPGGGYILSPSHNIQADTPPENILAMCEAAQKYGVYPIR